MRKYRNIIRVQYSFIDFQKTYNSKQTHYGNVEKNLKFLKN